MLVKEKPELASCITGCLQIAEDICVRLFNLQVIKANEKCKPERYEVMDNFKKLRMRILRSMNEQQSEKFHQINAEISDELESEINALLSFYQTELTTKVKYNFIIPVSYYITANEFILLSQLYYIKLFGGKNRFIEVLADSMINFSNRVSDVNLNPENKIQIKNENIELLYQKIIQKIIQQSLK